MRHPIAHRIIVLAYIIALGIIAFLLGVSVERAEAHGLHARAVTIEDARWAPDEVRAIKPGRAIRLRRACTEVQPYTRDGHATRDHFLPRRTVTTSLGRVVAVKRGHTITNRSARTIDVACWES